MNQLRTVHSLVLAAAAAGAGALLLGCTTSTLTTTPSPVKCQVSVPSSVPMVTATGGSATVAVSAPPECSWSASAESTWIANITPKSGQGNASLEVVVAANPAATTRVGNLKINDAVVPITQEGAACPFTVSGPANAVAAGGGSVTINIATRDGCTWTATSDTAWLTVSGSAAGAGSASVVFAATSNAGSSRTATISVGDQRVSVNQDGQGASPGPSPSPGPGGPAPSPAPPAPCSYSLGGNAQFVGNAAGAATPVSVNTDGGCSWTAETADSWITITGGASGGGPGSVSFSVTANTGGERTGRLTIAGLPYTVTQAPANCSYNISTNVVSATNAGGAGSPIAVSTNIPSCSWTANSNDAWLSITGGSLGTGGGNVTYNVLANPGLERTGTLNIAGHTVRVTQAAAACSYSLSASSTTLPSGGGAGTPVNLTANLPTCTWTVSSSDSWLTITSGTPAPGSGTVTYSASANLGSARSARLTIAGLTFTVNQDAITCSYSIAPTTESIPSTAGTGTSITVTTNLSTCTWTAVSNDPSWLTITPGASGLGNGPVGYTFAANSGPARSGKLTIAGQTFTANQADGCKFTLDRSSQSMPAAAGAGPPVSVATSPGCTWTAVSSAPSWLTVTSGASGVGNGAVGFSVTANTTGADRSAPITIAGNTFTVTQAR